MLCLSFSEPAQSMVTLEEMDKFITQIQKEFTLTIVEKLNQVLKIHLHYNIEKGKHSLNSDKYIKKSERKTQVIAAKKALTPPFKPL